MAYRAPKGITNHPAVKGCFCGDAEGSDSKHYVELNDGWALPRGHRNEGGSATFCNTVAEFTDFPPVQVAPAFRQGDAL